MSLQDGIPYIHNRWRQVNQEDHNADAQRGKSSVPQPNARATYYSSCAKIDQHMRHHQDILNLENKLVVHDWSKQVNRTLFGMMVVDSWLAFNGCTSSEETQKELYVLLSEDLIYNVYDNLNMARQGQWHAEATSPTLAAGTGVPRSGVMLYITPTKRKRVKKDGTVTKYLMQGRCMECGTKSTYFCSQCVDDKAASLTNSTPGDPWICGTKSGKLCYATHMNKKNLV